MPGTSIDLEAYESRSFALAAGSLIVGIAVTIGTLGWPPGSDEGVPLPEVVRDITRDREAANVAVIGPPGSSDHFRPPGAVVVLMPTLLMPEDSLIWTTAVVNVMAVAFVTVAAVRLTDPANGLIVAFLVPISVPFTQSVLHGSLFPVLAACIVWFWLGSVRGREWMPGVLLGVAASARLWPIALTVPLLLHGKWKAVASVVGTVIVLNAVGLALPGVSWDATFASLGQSSDLWIPAVHNGSVAAWLSGMTPAAAVLGLILVAIPWAIGMRKFESLDAKTAWTVPASILASPLAWTPYLLAMAPIVTRSPTSRWSRVLRLGIAVLLLVGFRWVPERITVTASALSAWMIVWLDRRAQSETGLMSPQRWHQSDE